MAAKQLAVFDGAEFASVDLLAGSTVDPVSVASEALPRAVAWDDCARKQRGLAETLDPVGGTAVVYNTDKMQSQTSLATGLSKWMECSGSVMAKSKIVSTWIWIFSNSGCNIQVR
jgi:hypothetical protein